MINRHSICISDELWAALRERYGPREVSDGVEALCRAGLKMPPVPPREQGGRFTSENNPRKREPVGADRGVQPVAKRALPMHYPNWTIATTPPKDEVYVDSLGVRCPDPLPD